MNVKGTKSARFCKIANIGNMCQNGLEWGLLRS